MRFSIIMPSYLGEYRTAAKDRDRKIIRAVNSVIDQTFKDWELVVVADGCEKTVKIMERLNNPQLSVHLIPKAKQWSGEPRNKGLQEAKGDYILYLDIDDWFGEDHLKNISEQLGTFDWVWFDDIRYEPKTDQWYENPCDITEIGRHGTSNVCHKRTLPAKWDYVGYAHDFYFVARLRENGNYAKISNGEYYVMHIPGIYDK
jgi:glycosyltransferase involved in cell wall biosynthesis